MINLNGKWQLCYNGIEQEIEVPGVIEKYVEKKDEKFDYSYRKTFSVDIKNNKKYILNCEGISYAYTILVNNKEVVHHEGIWEHLKVDVSEYLENENIIEIKIIRPSFEKESPYFFRSLLFGFIPDVLLPFSGIFRPIYVEEKNESYINECRVYANYDNKTLDVSCDINSFGNCKLEVKITSPDGVETVTISDYDKCSIPVDVVNWSTYQPNLYNIEVSLIKNNEKIDSYNCKRGFRKIEAVDEKIMLNGKREYFRAILHWGYYPEEMSFNISHEKIYEEIMMIKNQGFNAIKFCLFLPDKYYLDLCDELGILVWQELPLWLPYDNGFLQARIDNQYPNMIKYFIDRPSLLLVSIGCELDATVSQATIDSIYDDIKSYNSSAIICDNSGSGECFDGNLDTKSDIYDYHFYPEINNMQNLIDAFNHESRDKKPWLFGEYNDMDSFRNLKDIVKQLGEKPFWASDKFSENLLRYVHAGFGSDNPIYYFDKIVDEYGYTDSLDEIVKIGLKKAYDVRKYNLETTRSNDGISGYSITAIRDVPITACGIVDDFDKPKFADEDMLMINNDIVISMLPKLGRKWYKGSDIYDRKDIFNFENGSNINNRVVISSHLYNDVSDELHIILYDKHNEIVYKNSVNINVEHSKSKQYYDLFIPIKQSEYIEKYKLVIEFANYKNQWNVWGYPKNYCTPKFYLFDNNNMFEGIENRFDCHLINDFDGLKDCILVTTTYNKSMEYLRDNGVKIVYVQNGNGYYNYDVIPFWRENVKLIADNNYLSELEHEGYDGLNFISMIANNGFDSCYVKKMYPNYCSLIRRIDNRNFKAHEIAFVVNDNKEKMVVTSFDFGAGKGSQSRSFESNYLGQAILDKLIKIVVN